MNLFNRKTRYVVGFMLSADMSQVVLIQKNRPAWQRGRLNGVGGKIDSTDSSSLSCMIREFEEETGLVVKSWQLFCTLTGKDFIVDFYYSVGDVEKVDTVTDEKVAIFDICMLPPAVLPNIRWLIQMALSMKNGEKCHHFDIKQVD